MATIAPRRRMTAQSKSNIHAAVDATLIPANGGGYHVELVGANGNSAYVENADGPIAYTSMSTAKTAVRKHNSALNPMLKPTI